MVRHVYQGQVAFHSGDAELAPGITLHLVGGHTLEIQSVRVRIGRAMGAREGTRPEDDPLTRSLNAKAREEGRAEGREGGRAEGCRGGRLVERVEAVLEALRKRGIRTAPGFAEDQELFAGASLRALMAAALACAGEADFRRRLSEGGR